jgi:hypothetical protein
MKLAIPFKISSTVGPLAPDTPTSELALPRTLQGPALDWIEGAKDSDTVAIKQAMLVARPKQSQPQANGRHGRTLPTPNEDFGNDSAIPRTRRGAKLRKPQEILAEREGLLGAERLAPSGPPFGC